MEFKRARSDAQRTERRRRILDTAAAMLAEMPVATVSLNELSRRIGLAKSNVLRYFESREAILLELLDAEIRDLLVELDGSLMAGGGDVRERGDRLAGVLAAALARRPVLCDLISAQAAVLERNVSAETALAYKRATRQTAEVQIRLIRRCLPELGVQDATRLLAITMLVVSAAWPHANPPAALVSAYEADPELAGMRIDFAGLVGQTIAVTISGLLARGEDVPAGVAPL